MLKLAVMEKTIRKPESVPGTGPSKDELVKWVRKDLDAAVYFLELVRRDTKAIDKIADHLYERWQEEKEMLKTNGQEAVKNGFTK